MLAPQETARDAQRVPMLDVLRFVAIAAVASFHFGFLGPPGIGTEGVAVPALSAFARYGYLGVPVFFMISGFVIAFSADNKTAMEFAVARFVRIYPTFLLCMTLTMIMTATFGGPRFFAGFSQWAANLVIAAPAFGRPYADLAYWSLVLEVTFYAWVAGLIVFNVFPKRIDSLVAIWLGITFVNELTIDSTIVEKVFLSDYSGFFATGLMTYELHKGRRDLQAQALLALSVGCAVFLAIHKLEWLRANAHAQFDDGVVATIIVASAAVVLCSTRIARLPLPAGAVLAIGGVTYPFYLLHQQIGYDVLNALGANRPHPATVAAVLMGVLLLSWLIWRYFERPLHGWMRRALRAALRRRSQDLAKASPT